MEQLYGRSPSARRGQRRRASPRALAYIFALLICTVGSLPLVAKSVDKIRLQRTTVDLPSRALSIQPWDYDGDGNNDLLLVLNFSAVESIGSSRIENGMQIETVMPALADRREAWILRNEGGGKYLPPERLLELSPAVLALSVVDKRLVFALSDSGVQRLVQGQDVWELEAFLEEPPISAGSRLFSADLDMALDLNGDRFEDLLVPVPSGWSIHLGSPTGPSKTPSQRISTLPLQMGAPGDGRGFAPWPTLDDLNLDGHTDLVARDFDGRPHVWFGSPQGFRPGFSRDTCSSSETLLRQLRADGSTRPIRGDVVFVGDLDGVGNFDVVTTDKVDLQKDGLRASLKDAKKPNFEFRVFGTDDQGRVLAEPRRTFVAEGYPVDEATPFSQVNQFVDLDNDGVKEMIAVTLDFGIFQALRVVTSKKISIELNFHVWRQKTAGAFEQVPDLDLSEKLKIDFRDIRITRMAQFAGDFDGDGRIDFVHFGRGKKITVHRGQAEAKYPRDPDLEILLEQEASDLQWVQVQDCDGDGRADLVLATERPKRKAEETAPVTLDLYLSGAEE